MQLKNFQNKINNLLVDICWCHWRRLGAYASGPVNHRSTDPEALILLTCLVGNHDLRLFEIMGQWLQSYHSLIPIDRMKSICEKAFNDDTSKKYIKIFAAVLKASLTASELKRWKSISDKASNSSQNTDSIPFHLKKIESRKKIEMHTDVMKHNLQLRLRYIFGPGSRADIYYISHILSSQKKPYLSFLISPSSLAEWLYYDRSSIHRILDDFEKGQLLERTEESKNGKFLAYQFREKSKYCIQTENKEETFIDWFQILRMTFQWLTFENWLSNLKIPLREESNIITNYLYSTCKDIPRFARLTHIPEKFPVFSAEAIEQIPRKLILDGIYQSFKLSYKFISAKP